MNIVIQSSHVSATNSQLEKLTCCREEAGEGSLSSAFHSRSIWWSCSSRSATSIVRLSFLANCRSKNMTCRSSTWFLALSLKSLCDADLQLLLEIFFITKLQYLPIRHWDHQYKVSVYHIKTRRKKIKRCKQLPSLSWSLSLIRSIFQLTHPTPKVQRF